jgi:hypothetical protein
MANTRAQFKKALEELLSDKKAKAHTTFSHDIYSFVSLPFHNVDIVHTVCRLYAMHECDRSTHCVKHLTCCNVLSKMIAP